MRGLVYQGPLDVEVVDVPDPTPFDLDAAVVQVEACGICGSDLHIYEGHGFSQDTGYCVGHEAVGVVAEVGSAVRSFRVGDRVLVPGSTGCVSCHQCRRGQVALCERGLAGVYGINARLPGSQAEAVAVPFADGNLTRIPDAISDDDALVLTDNMPTAWFGARRAGIEPGDTVAVVGCGPVGLCSIMSAFVLGAGRVLAIDLVPERRARAAALGAEPVDGDDVVAAIAELTGGRLADVVLEAVGADATVRLSIDLAGRHGSVSVVGVNQSRSFDFPMAKAQGKSLRFTIGLCSVQYELPALLDLTVGGRIRPGLVVSDHVPLSEGVDAYRRFHAREDGVSKIVLDPSR